MKKKNILFCLPFLFSFSVVEAYVLESLSVLSGVANPIAALFSRSAVGFTMIAHNACDSYVKQEQINQLIDNITFLENMCVQLASEVAGAIDTWNSHIRVLTDSIACQAYKCVLISDYALTDLCKAYDELIAVADCYQIYNNKSFRFSTAIIQILEKNLPEIIKKRQVVCDAIRSNHNDVVMIGRYCAGRNIPIASLKDGVKKDFERHKSNYENKSLENVEVAVFGGFPDGPKKGDEDEDGVDKIIEISKDDAPHMFGDRSGHLPDTLENRKLLINLVSNKENFLGVDSYGTEWYAKIMNDGRQLWAYVRNRLIRNGGINNVPREFNSTTGLCKPSKSFK